jgi:hypothetical protein
LIALRNIIDILDSASVRAFEWSSISSGPTRILTLFQLSSQPDHRKDIETTTDDPPGVVFENANQHDMPVSWLLRREYMETKPILPIEIFQSPNNASAIQGPGHRGIDEDGNSASPKSNARHLKPIPDVSVSFQGDFMSFLVPSLTYINRSSASNTALCRVNFHRRALEK